MALDPLALESATQALGDRLRSEADEQNAYLVRLPDGRVSVELEWIDIQSIAQHVIAAYVAQLTRSDSET
jgi:hypothetical protein